MLDKSSYVIAQPLAYIVLAFALIIGPTVSAADDQGWVTWSAGVNYDARNEVLYVAGEITNRFADAIEQLARNNGKVNNLIVVEPGSPGGDVQAALRIGRVLRKLEVQAHLYAPCASACVLMIAGAVYRGTGRTVGPNLIGLHRPFATTASASFAAEQTRVNMYSDEIRRYMSEMNIGPGFFEAMTRVDPQNIRWVSTTEIASLGMPEWDPVYFEYRVGQRADELGISRKELNRRLRLREDKCDRIQDLAERCNCTVRIGLSSPGKTCDRFGIVSSPTK